VGNGEKEEHSQPRISNQTREGDTWGHVVAQNRKMNRDGEHSQLKGLLIAPGLKSQADGDRRGERRRGRRGGTERGGPGTESGRQAVRRCGGGEVQGWDTSRAGRSDQNGEVGTRSRGGKDGEAAVGAGEGREMAGAQLSGRARVPSIAEHRTQRQDVVRAHGGALGPGGCGPHRGRSGRGARAPGARRRQTLA
jgi:hypothetical protein